MPYIHCQLVTTDLIKLIILLLTYELCHYNIFIIALFPHNIYFKSYCEYVCMLSVL